MCPPGLVPARHVRDLSRGIRAYILAYYSRRGVQIQSSTLAETYLDKFPCVLKPRMLDRLASGSPWSGKYSHPNTSPRTQFLIWEPARAEPRTVHRVEQRQRSLASDSQYNHVCSREPPRLKTRRNGHNSRKRQQAIKIKTNTPTHCHQRI
jgi:hypothetical protein